MGRWWPCAPCCPGGDACLIGTDDFNRANNDNVGDDWLELSTPSGWKIASNVLETTLANDVILYRKPHPGGFGDVKAWVSVLGGVGDVFRLLVSYIDADNYLYGQAEFDTGKIYVSLWRRLGGVNTQLGTTKEVYSPNPLGYANIIVCRQAEDYPTSSWASVLVISSDGGWQYVKEDVAGPIAPYAALATAALPSGSGKFDNFNYYKLKSTHDPLCPECMEPLNCAYCDSGMPYHLKVTIAGVGYCGMLNGTWVLPFRTDNPFTIYGYGWPFAFPPCSYWGIWNYPAAPILIACSFEKRVGRDYVSVYGSVPGIGYGNWSINPAGLVTCLDFDVNLNYVYGLACIGVGSTCRVQTLPI